MRPEAELPALLREAHRRLGPAQWKHQVLDRVVRGLARLEKSETGGGASSAVRTLYAEAVRLVAARGGWLRGMRTWLTGAEIDAAWRQVHAAEETLVLVEDETAVRAEIPGLMTAVNESLPAGDERRTMYLSALAELQRTDRPDPQLLYEEREQIRAIKATLNETNDDAHARLRSFRNLALAATAALTAVVVVLAFDPPGDEWLPVCAPPDAGGTPPECATVAQIEVVGALGGLLAVVAALVAFQGFSGPYALPGVMAALKVPAGALTGLLGAIWMQSEVFGFKAQPGSKVLAYVAIFGFAQQAITAFADRQAGRLLGQAQGNPSP